MTTHSQGLGVSRYGRSRLSVKRRGPRVGTPGHGQSAKKMAEMRELAKAAKARKRQERIAARQRRLDGIMNVRFDQQAQEMPVLVRCVTCGRTARVAAKDAASWECDHGAV